MEGPTSSEPFGYPWNRGRAQVASKRCSCSWAPVSRLLRITCAGVGVKQERCQLRGGTCQLRGGAVSTAWIEHSAALAPTPSACLPNPWQSRSPLHHAVAGQSGASALLHRSGESNQSEHPRPGLAFQTSGAAGSARRRLGWAMMPRSFKKGPQHFSYWATSEKAAAGIRDGNCQVSLCLLRGMSCSQGY